MLFFTESYYIYFLPTVFLAFCICGRFRNPSLVIGLLVGASWFFYAWWEWRFLPVLLLSLLVNRTIAETFGMKGVLSDQRLAKRVLAAGVLFNLSLLGYFKYVDFFLGNFGLNENFDFAKVALPLGISFFTFQQIAYLAECRKQGSTLCPRLQYLFFISFFPQLIAGPIVYYKEILPQIEKPEWFCFKFRNICAGVVLFVFGLFKKVVVADTFGVVSDILYSRPETTDILGAWMAIVSFAIQIYYDFSGYCDMAVGSALLFNIRLPRNFRYPYLAPNLGEFWRRWNITLSRWLRDYLYRPLGGTRKSIPMTLRNLILTFLLSGLWHGAAWTFAFWGFLHGVGVAGQHAWARMGMRLPKALGVLLTFAFFILTAVYFRASDLADGNRVLLGAFGYAEGEGCWPLVGVALESCLGGYGLSSWLPGLKDSVLVILLGLALWSVLEHVARIDAHERLVSEDLPVRLTDWALVACGVLCVVLFTNVATKSPFIYFEF